MVDHVLNNVCEAVVRQTIHGESRGQDVPAGRVEISRSGPNRACPRSSMPQRRPVIGDTRLWKSAAPQLQAS